MHLEKQIMKLVLLDELTFYLFAFVWNTNIISWFYRFVTNNQLSKIMAKFE